MDKKSKNEAWSMVNGVWIGGTPGTDNGDFKDPQNAGVNKGKATMNWLNEKEWDYIMALGDDHTDEDIFKALPDTAHTIKVGLDKSVARYHLLSVKDVREFLLAFAE